MWTCSHIDYESGLLQSSSKKEKNKTCSLNGCGFVLQYLEILCLDAVILTDIMLYFGITRLNGPNIIPVVILLKMGMGRKYNMMQNCRQILKSRQCQYLSGLSRSLNCVGTPPDIIILKLP